MDWAQKEMKTTDLGDKRLDEHSPRLRNCHIFGKIENPGLRANILAW